MTTMERFQEVAAERDALEFTINYLTAALAKTNQELDELSVKLTAGLEDLVNVDVEEEPASFTCEEEFYPHMADLMPAEPGIPADLM